MGWMLTSDQVSCDIALLFKSRSDALAWAKSKGLDLSGVLIRPLASPDAVHWL